MFDPAKYATVTVVERRDISSDLWVIRIRPDSELAFRPGQYVTLGLQQDDHIVERPYSIVSAPTEPEIELFLERVPGGELSEPLHQLGIGAQLAVRRRPKGLFLKDAPVDGQPHLLVATVTGVAPFLSMLRVLAGKWRNGEAPENQRFMMIQGASHVHELGYETELRELDEELPWFTYVPTVSRPWDNTEWTGETGRVEDVLRKYADEAGLRPGAGAIFLCGHPGMIHNARAIMRRRGFDDKEIREEQYWPE
ncbi:MAG TPA: FAD-binding oxidoreductase [Candidatus Sulfotelmatobacter sp.]|jgi:ferredoxin--NADP+ reductase|nr:FAD-binding oxidoreductase [Candidatus Sulfotelmatobacter sp.]